MLVERDYMKDTAQSHVRTHSPKPSIRLPQYSPTQWFNVLIAILGFLITGVILSHILR